ncbi:hypothetical protein [Streptomyces spiralis]
MTSALTTSSVTKAASPLHRARQSRDHAFTLEAVTRITTTGRRVR